MPCLGAAMPLGMQSARDVPSAVVVQRGVFFGADMLAAGFGAGGLVRLRSNLVHGGIFCAPQKGICRAGMKVAHGLLRGLQVGALA